MPGQLSWEEFFANEERQRAARHKLLDALPADRRVIELLKLLDELAHEHGYDECTTYVPDGTVLVKVPLKVLRQRLRLRSKNSIRVRIELAASTPWLSAKTRGNEPYTFTIFWPTILDPSAELPAEVHADQKSRGRDCPNVASRGTRTSRGGGETGGQLSDRRGSDLTPSDTREGVSFGRRRGSTDRGQGGQVLTGVSGSKSPPAFYTPPSGCSGFLNKRASKNLESPGAVTGVSGDPLGRPQWQPWFWPRWKRLLAERDLAKPADVEELYAVAVAGGCFVPSQVNRERVFAQAAKQLRLHRERRAKGKTPTAVFRENVAHARWFHGCEDVDAGCRMIAELDWDRDREEIAARQLAGENAERRDRNREFQEQSAAKAKFEKWAAQRGEA
jgi:hypothetical protein